MVSVPPSAPIRSLSPVRPLACDRGLAGNPEGGARELESYLRVLRFMGRLAGCPEPSIAMR
jgi:hypothetical protein